MTAAELVKIFNEQARGIVTSCVLPNGHTVRMEIAPDNRSEMSLRDNSPENIIGEWESLMSMEKTEQIVLDVPGAA